MLTSSLRDSLLAHSGPAFSASIGMALEYFIDVGEHGKERATFGQIAIGSEHTQRCLQLHPYLSAIFCPYAQLPAACVKYLPCLLVTLPLLRLSRKVCLNFGKLQTDPYG